MDVPSDDSIRQDTIHEKLLLYKSTFSNRPELFNTPEILESRAGPRRRIATSAFFPAFDEKGDRPIIGGFVLDVEIASRNFSSTSMISHAFATLASALTRVSAGTLFFIIRLRTLHDRLSI